MADDVTVSKKGLSKKLGDTGLRMVRGGHWPWEYLVYHGDVAIAGVDEDFFKFLRARHRTTSLAAQDDLVEALRTYQDRIVSLMASIKQGRSSTPRSEAPSQWDVDWCRDQFDLVLAALASIKVKP